MQRDRHKVRFVAFALLCAAWMGVGGSAAAASDALVSVGTAKVDVTPDGPIRLSGYGARRDASEGVAQRLWAKALAFGADDEGPAVLITADLIGFPAWIVEQVAQRLSQRAGIAPANVVLLATHTHTGPVVLGTIPNLFGERIPPGELRAIDRYTMDLVDRLEAVAFEALAARAPARVSWAQGEVSFAANRRVVQEGRWTGFGVDPEGPVDHDLPVLRVTDEEGNLRAVLLSYACHCTTLTGSFNEVHGDWAASAAEMIEAAHPGAIALVAIGTGADQNPEPRGDPEHVEWHATEIAEEVERLLAGSMREISSAPRGRNTTVALPYERVPTLSEFADRVEEGGSGAFHAQMMLDRLARGEELPRSLSYPVQVWAFGDDLVMVFLAGEVVVDYGLRLKRELERVWVNAYANELVCYIPSRRIIPEGGYEVDASMIYYDRPSRFSADVEDLIIETVRTLTPPAFLRAE